MNRQIYMVCAYSREIYTMIDEQQTYHGNNFKRQNSINIFQFINEEKQVPFSPSSYLYSSHSSLTKIELVDSIDNELYTDNFIAIHHEQEAGNHYFYLVTRNSVVMYLWDGRSLLSYDKLIENEYVKAFGVVKRTELPSLIVSSDGYSFRTYIKEHGTTRPDSQPKFQILDGFEVKRLQVFKWANNYYVWTLFHRVDNPTSTLNSYGTIAAVGFDEPRDSKLIPSYRRCLNSMEQHLEKTISKVKMLHSKSDDILIVNSQNPLITVPVKVKRVVITGRIKPTTTVGMNINGK